MTKKVWKQEEITDLLNRNHKAVDQGIIRLAGQLAEITESWEDRTLITMFDRYIEGLDGKGRPKWKSGRYKDTVSLVAMRKDIVLPEQKQFPLDITHIGEPTSEHYQMYAKDWSYAGDRIEDPHSEVFFKETYFIVKRREHYLD